MCIKLYKIIIWIYLFRVVFSLPHFNQVQLSIPRGKFKRWPTLKRNYTRADILRLKRDPQTITFPDPSEETVNDDNGRISLRIKGPPACAEDSTFCEDFKYYPRDYLHKVLRKRKVSPILFGIDEGPEDFVHRTLENEETFVCQAVQKTIFPKIGKNRRNEWKFIINQEDDGYVQGVKIEVCAKVGSPCDIIDPFPFGFKTFCRQKYIYRRLMSLTDSGVPYADTFVLPSACCCAYKKEFDLFSRSAVTKASKRKRRRK